MGDRRAALEVEEEFDPGLLGGWTEPHFIDGAESDGESKVVIDRAHLLLQGILEGISPKVANNVDVKEVTSNSQAFQFQAIEVDKQATSTPFEYPATDWTQAKEFSEPSASPPFSFHPLHTHDAPTDTSTASFPLEDSNHAAPPSPEPVIYRDYAVGSPSPRVKTEPLDHPPNLPHDAAAIEGESFDQTHAVPPHRTVNIIQTRSRLAGKRTYRPGIRVIRTSPSLPTEPESIEIKTEDEDRPPSPQRPPGYRGDLVQSLGYDTLSKLSLLSHDSPYLPPQLRTLFAPLSDPNAFLLLTNSLRSTLNLPRLRLTKKSRLPLIRIIARTRQTLFTELLSGLILPLAPVPPPGMTDEETTDEESMVKEEVKESIKLTPGNLEIMRKVLPKVFVDEKKEIKAFLKGEVDEGVVGSGYGVYGEESGRVVWQGGVGRVVGGEGGFRGKVGEGLGTHVFVDHSNILHGLLSALHPSTSPSLPPKHLRTLSLPLLSLLLRRGRPTPPGTLHLVASSPLHQPLDPLVRLGWEVSILKRVEVLQGEVEDPTSMHLTPKITSGVLASESVGIGRFKEQGVDEILHLKVLQALNGGKGGRGRIVLATGDAKGGQFNRDGFMGAVREGLRRGWEVELWSFSAGLSRAWYEVGKRERWFERGFEIHEMDEWAELLVEVSD